MDNKLSWKAQGALALTKAQDWLGRFKRIALTTKGIHAKFFHCLYIPTAIPCILYAADIFLTPNRHVGLNSLYKKANQQAIIKDLVKIHREITGAKFLFEPNFAK